MKRTVGIAATAATAAVATALMAPQAEAQSDGDSPMASVLAVEIATLREQYEARIKALEEQIKVLQSRAGITVDTPDGHGHGMAAPPQISAVLRGMVTSFSAEHSEVPGFQFGHESERPPQGLALGHSELSLVGDVGNALHGGVVLGIGAHPGEPAELELEEAYFQTLPGLGLPEELTVTAGRKLWSFGYLNERHAHEDDFADRPLPYRAFLDGAYNDDGIQLSLSLPGDIRTEIGGGLFRGDDRPFGGSSDGLRAYSAYARIGGDMGRDSSWGIGLSLLSGEVGARGGGHAHAHGDEHDDEGDAHDHDDEMDHHDDEDMDDHDHDHDDEMDHHDDEEDHHDDEMDHEDEHDHDDEEDHHDDEMDHADEHDHEEMEPVAFFSDGVFSGESGLFGTDFRFAWSPTGDAWQSQVILQGEYLWQIDDGVYMLMDEHELDVNGQSSGWYAQAVYKFAPQWRIGARYAQLSQHGAAEVDHDPSALAIMGDWTSDRFGQVRLQYNRESLAAGQEDDQVILQYTVSLGGHDGHDH